MQLFDDIQHDYNGPRQHLESSYEYLNRSVRDPAARIRQILEEWAKRFPSDDKKDFVRRFQSSNDAHHYGALLELYCCELIRGHGLSVKPHPTTETEKSTHPDFLVSRGNEPICYVECTLAADPMVAPAEQARRNVVLDGLNKLDPRHFFITVEFATVGKSSPSVGKLRHQIEMWLRSLDDAPQDDSAFEVDSPATRTWNVDGWTLTFHAHRSNRNDSGTKRRGISGQMEGMRRIDSSGRLRKTLLEKVKRYGRDLKLPYVIAVNSLDDILEDCDVMEALFGEMRYAINIKTGRSYKERTNNGLWTRKKGYRYRRVSAVLVIGNLTPWTLWTAPAVLWHHPAPSYSLQPSVWRLPQMLPDSRQNKMVRRDGSPAAVILGLKTTTNHRANGDALSPLDQ